MPPEGLRRHPSPSLERAMERGRLGVPEHVGDFSDRVAAVYRDDAVELQPCRTPVRGRAAIEQRYRNLFNSSARVTAFTFSHIDAMTDGNLAYDVGTYEQRLALRSGDTMTDAGKYLVILRRTQGEWKAAYAIYSSDAGSAQ
jgi:ketosteroid isomerase-like protein